MTAILDAAGALDTAKLPLAAPVGWMQRWLHDLLVEAGRLIRYYPDERAALAALAPRHECRQAAGLRAVLAARLALWPPHLNVRMQLEQLLLALPRPVCRRLTFH